MSTSGGAGGSGRGFRPHLSASEDAATERAEPDFAHASFEAVQVEQAEVERRWATYWRPLIELPDGSLNMAALKAELFEAYELVDRVRKVYLHITGGLTQDATIPAEGIIAAHDARIERLIEGPRELLRDREALLRDARLKVRDASELLRSLRDEVSLLRAQRAALDPPDS
jgi:hypothetical protein